MSSALSAEALTTASVSFEELVSDGSRCVWIELEVGDPPDLRVADSTGRLTSAGVLVGTGLYEYGGGAVALTAAGLVYSSKADDRLYVQAKGAAPRPITGEAPCRYGDLGVDLARQRIVCVEEDRRESTRLPTHRVVSIALDGARRVLAKGADFYSSPRVSPDGRAVAWVEWDVPNMPWDSTRLMRAALDDDGYAGAASVVVGDTDDSLAYPRWSPDNTLHYLSDRTGWWNIYRVDDAGGSTAVLPIAADIGFPGYTQSRCAYDVGANSIAAVATADGHQRLLVLDRQRGAVREANPGSLTVFMLPRIVGDRVAFIGGSAAEPLSVWSVRTAPQQSAPTLVKAATADVFDREQFAEPERITYPTTDDAFAHAYFYRPPGTAGQRLPLIVFVHGGPVAAAIPAATFGVLTSAAPAYWTSRGYAYVEVDYRGSVGYGRAYRRALRGRWGQVDVADCVAAVEYLAQRGDIDRERVVIRGGSAGGFTTVMALATTKDVFACGTSYFPVADFAAFDQLAHKYEAHFNFSLVGPPDEYEARSPARLAAQISVPLLIVQGSDDAVCPHGQTELVVAAIREAGGDVTYHLVDGEAHGFVQAENIVRGLHDEERFYAKVLGLPPPGTASPKR